MQAEERPAPHPFGDPARQAGVLQSSREGPHEDVAKEFGVQRPPGQHRVARQRAVGGVVRVEDEEGLGSEVTDRELALRRVFARFPVVGRLHAGALQGVSVDEQIEQEHRQRMQVGDRRGQGLLADDLRCHEAQRPPDEDPLVVGAHIVVVEDRHLGVRRIHCQVAETDVPVAQPRRVQRSKRVDKLAGDGGDDPERRLHRLAQQLGEGGEAGLHQRHHIAEAVDPVARHHVDRPDEGGMGRPPPFDELFDGLALLDRARSWPVELHRERRVVHQHPVDDTLAAFAQAFLHGQHGAGPLHPELGAGAGELVHREATSSP